MVKMILLTRPESSLREIERVPLPKREVGAPPMPSIEPVEGTKWEKRAT